MRHTWFRTALLLFVASAVSLAAPLTKRGRSAPRDVVQLVHGREAAAREALVRFRGAPLPAAVEEVRVDADAERMEAIGGRGVLRVRSRSLHAADLVARLSRRGDVLYAEPNYVVRILEPPNDASFSELWGLSNVGQAVNGGFPGTPDADIRALPAWDVTVGSTSHVVAVIDTGVDYGHADLAPNMWSAPARFTVDLGGGRAVTCNAGTHGYNAIRRTCDPMDDHMHGTHVAGTIGAVGNDGNGVVGVNWTTSIMALKFLGSDGSGTVADAVDSIRFAIQAKRTLQAAANVRVLSNSWGAGSFSQALLDEIEAARAEDVLFVAAAGNDGSSNDLQPFYPAGYQASNVVAVAATTNTDDRASFSNYGAATVHLGAPGEDILSTIPGNGYRFASGTSMATPHVSGAATLVLSRCALDTTGLKDVLLSTAHPVEALASVTITGGRLDVNSAVHSCVAPPESPTGLAAAGFDGEVRLSWSAALGATRYSVRRSTTAGGPYTAIAEDLKGARYTDRAVVNGTTYYYVVSAANPVGESGDSNEASATPHAPSDLVVSSLTVPATAGAGSMLAVAVTTTNASGAPAVASTTRLYLSLNALFDAADWALEPAHEVPALAPGVSSSASLSLAIPADTAAGLWYVIAVADAAGVVNETQEANNASLRSLKVGPDLVVTAVDAPSLAAPGQAIAVSDVVKNQGAGAAGPSTTHFYLSTDFALDGSDTLLAGARAISGLGGDATSAGASTVTIPPAIAAGRYYLVAKADGGGAVAESSETNNTFARQIGIGADLVVSSFSAPATGGAGQSIVVSDTTKNEGAAGAGSTVTRFYLSTNYQLDAADTELGNREVPSLGAGESSTATTTLTIPGATPTASYYLIAVADGHGAVLEASESDNQRSAHVQVGGDLRVSSLTAPGSAGPGSTIAVGDTTVNQGGGAIGATSTRYYFSANAQLDAADRPLGGRALPPLAAGASHTGSAGVTIPADAATGTFYIIAKADADEVATETQESNNVTARAILVGGDLAVTALSAPAKGGAGLAVVVTDTVANQGAAAVPASVARFYYSDNWALDASDILLSGSRAVPALAPGASSSGSTTVTLPATATPGLRYLLAKADADDAIAETQESNNASARAISIGPDLTVTALTAPLNSAAGSTVGVTDTTANQGAGAAAASVTTFLLSANWSIDASDVTLDASRAVGGLAPGASSSGTTSVTIPAGTAPGTYYLFANADGLASIAEGTENNNARATTIRVGPDLAISSASLPASSIAAGATGTVTDTVSNQGAGPAAPSTTRFYLSVNWAYDGAADVLLPGARTVLQLAAGASSSGSTVITIPTGTAAGSYYVLARADGDDAIPESLENNNVRLVRSISVTAP